MTLQRRCTRLSGFASLVLIAWLVTGVIVAADHHYFADLKTFGAVLSAPVAILLWPLILIGTKIAITT